MFLNFWRGVYEWGWFFFFNSCNGITVTKFNLRSRMPNPIDITNLGRFWLYCLCPLVFLITENFNYLAFQSLDFGLWTSINVQKEIVKNPVLKSTIFSGCILYMIYQNVWSITKKVTHYVSILIIFSEV